MGPDFAEGGIPLSKFGSGHSFNSASVGGESSKLCIICKLNSRGRALQSSVAVLDQAEAGCIAQLSYFF